MRNILILVTAAILWSCEKNETFSKLPEVPVDITLNLNLPQYNKLQTPSSWIYINGGNNGIYIQNIGVGNPPYKAFDAACPNNDCSTPMTFDGSLKLKCSCDNSEYSFIDGAPQTSGYKQFAKEYRVYVLNSNTLAITNF